MIKILTIACSLLFSMTLFMFTWEDSLAKDDKKEDEFKGKPEDLTGAKRCKKCHNTKAIGKQYEKWQNVPHYKAVELLGTPEAKKVAEEFEKTTKQKIGDPQKSGKCLVCHSTAYYFTEEVLTKEIPVEEGVSCESCHGPGNTYSEKATKVKEKEAQKAAHKPDINPHPEKVCTKCHNDSAPSWKKDRYTLKDGKKVGFDYEQAYKKIAHPVPHK